MDDARAVGICMIGTKPFEKVCDSKFVIESTLAVSEDTDGLIDNNDIGILVNNWQCLVGMCGLIGNIRRDMIVFVQRAFSGWWILKRVRLCLHLMILPIPTNR
jgi:hypothetical protein